MGDVAASGGYWISMDGDQIFAEPTTITGSIGIFGLFMNIPNTLAKIGVHTDGVGTTPLAGALDTAPARWIRTSAQLIQSMIDNGYQRLHLATSPRRATRRTAEIDAIARGRVWSGEQARQRGLVDRHRRPRTMRSRRRRRAAKLGGRYRVELRREANCRRGSSFALNMSSDALARVGHVLLPDSARVLFAQPEVRDQFKLLRALGGNKLGVFAYCFCEIR